MQRKIAEYLEKGVALVIVVDPDDATVTSYRAGRPAATFRVAGDRVDLGDILPGFCCRAGDLRVDRSSIA